MLTLPIAIVVIHFVGDFLIQDRFPWMGIGKSKSMPPLVFHVLSYSLCFLPFYGFKFFIVTFWLHLITDFITSRITSKLWFVKFLPKIDELIDSNELHAMYPYHAAIDMKKRGRFFDMIGFDQLIHMVTLAWTYKALFSTL